MKKPAPPSIPSQGRANTQAAFADADAFYEALLDAHQGLSSEESQAMNARLILILAHQIGDMELLADCISLARS